MQDRRDFLKTGFSIAAAGLAGAVAMTGARTSLATEAPPETTSLRFEKWPVTCLAPIYIVDDLLREEGFSDIRYMPGAWVGGGDADFGSDYSGPAIIPIEGGKPIVMLAGIDPGCFELFARETIGSVLDLRGRKVGVSFIGSGEHYVLISIIAANVGLDPAKEINWVAREPREQMELFANGEIDAFLANSASGAGTARSQVRPRDSQQHAGPALVPVLLLHAARQHRFRSPQPGRDQARGARRDEGHGHLRRQTGLGRAALGRSRLYI